MLDRAETLLDVLRGTARAYPTRGVHYPAQGAFLAYEELVSRSERVARRLRARGVERGEPVGMLLQQNAQFVTCFFGVQRAGGIPVPLALAGGRDIAGYLARLGHILDDAGVRTMIVDAGVLASFGGAVPGGLALVTGDELVDAAEATGPEPIEPSPDDVAFIQYTSGSTAVPKGVTITHANAVESLRSMARRARFTPDDVFCGWLPQFHDMGLIGNLLMAIGCGSETHIWPPSSFVKDPAAWIAYFARVKGTIYTGPNFSYALLCEDVAAERVGALDLSSLRLAFNGAEAVDADLMAAFADHFAPAGLRPEAIYPVYGLAEVVLGATFPEVGERVVVDWVDRAALNERRVRRAPRGSPAARGVVSLGRPIDALELRVVDDGGAALGDDRVGEVELRGAPVMRGYYRQEALTAASFHDGWLRTGDLGYVHDDRLYLVGRSKDLIKVAGESYYAEDVEAVVRGVDGVHRGTCAAFAGGLLGEERMTCVAETELAAAADLDRLARAVGAAVRHQLGLAAFDVVLVKKRSIPRTTSGKVQRHAMKRSVGEGSGEHVLHRIRL